MKNFASAVAAVVLYALSVAAQPSSLPASQPEDFSFTYRAPRGCVPGANNCRYFVGIQRNAGDPGYLDFALEGEARGWVAVGFSETRSMSDADVLGCIRFDDRVTAKDGWNVAQAKGRDNVLDMTQNDIVQHSSSYDSDRISCLFSRRAVGNDVDIGRDLDLSLPGANYYLLYGTGFDPVTLPENGTLSFTGHKTTPSISTMRVDLHPDGIESTNQSNKTDLFRHRMIQAHGILMIVGWLLFASPAILFASWMKPALPNGKWFQVHRAFHIFSLFLVLLAFILIFVANKDHNGLTDLKKAKNVAHFVIGILVVVLQIANPIIALFRCKPDAKYRWVFRVVHVYAVGYTLLLLALTNIGIGTALFSDDHGLVVFWVDLSYTVFFIVLAAVAAAVFAVTAKKVNPVIIPDLSESVRIVRRGERQDQEADEDDGKARVRPSRDAPLRWGFLVILLTVTVPIVLALIVLISLPQF